MSRSMLSAAMTVCLVPSVGFSESAVPRVVTDIPAVHSLVASIMQGRGTPDLLISGNASPHDFSLKPSQAAALEKADLIIWTSEGLTPWLEEAMSSLAQNTPKIELMALEGSEQLPLRDGTGHGEMHAEDKGHDDDDHDDHGEGDHGHEATDDHDHDHSHGHDHGDVDYDPHGWLDMDNAVLWAGEIAAQLATQDPSHADIYKANGLKLQTDLKAQSKQIARQLEPLTSRAFMTLHDGFQYFEHSFGLKFAGSIMLSDASPASPARVAAARSAVQDHMVRCVFTEPQQSTRLAQVVVEGTDAKLAVLDAIGADLSPGPALYSELMRNLARNASECLGD